MNCKECGYKFPESCECTAEELQKPYDLNEKKIELIGIYIMKVNEILSQLDRKLKDLE